MGRIGEAGQLYYRLVLVVAPSGGGKTGALQDVAKRTGARLVNVNLELSRLMLDLTERQRALQVGRLMEEIVAEVGEELVLLDNIEMLFDTALNQDPLRLLQRVSRNRTVVAAWNGAIKSGQLIYASPEHPGYRRYPVKDFLVITAPDTEAGMQRERR